MCQKLIINSETVVYRSHVNFQSNQYSGTTNGKWGLNSDMPPAQALIRVENLHNSWKEYFENRGFIEVDSFYLVNHSFYCQGSKLIIPVIFDNNYDFAIITHISRGIAAEVLTRQPITLRPGQEHLWLDDGIIVQLEEALLLSSKSPNTIIYT